MAPAKRTRPKGKSSSESEPKPIPANALAFIGTHLRAARLERHISLRELARRVGVSPSFVSQVELGKAKPSLGTLYAFLSELELSLDELMPDEIAEAQDEEVPLPDQTESRPSAPVPWDWPHPASPVQRADNRRRVQLTGVKWERLTSHDDPLVDFLHATYQPGAESCPADHLMRHVGREYGHIIEGWLDVQVQFEHYRLGPGDSINFDSATPHRLSNEGDKPCTSVWVVVGRRMGAGGGGVGIPSGDHFSLG